MITGKTESFEEGNSDAWLIKLDQNGIHEWNRTYGGPFLDYTSAIIPSNDGGYVLAGRTMSFGQGGEDMWLIKTNSMGEVEFDQTFGGIYADVAYGIVENGNEGYALTGRTSSFGVAETDLWLIIVGYKMKKIDGVSSALLITIMAIPVFILIRRFRFHTKKIVKLVH